MQSPPAWTGNNPFLVGVGRLCSLLVQFLTAVFGYTIVPSYRLLCAPKRPFCATLPLVIYLLLTLNFATMIALPIILGKLVQRHRKPGWGLFGIGAVTFVLSQVGHIPFNSLIQQQWQLLPTDTSILTNLVIVSAFLGLSAGVFEEVARYLTYRFWATDARSWGKGLMLGVGHGGIEAIILGVLGLINFGVMAAMRNGAMLDQIPPDQMHLVEQQINTLFSTPLHLSILGAVERVFALCLHLSASLLVMQAVIRGQARWVVASILWHAWLNAVTVFTAVYTGSPLLTEGMLGLFSLGSVAIIFWLKTPEPINPDELPVVPLPPVGPSAPLSIETTAESLEKSRYV